MESALCILSAGWIALPVIWSFSIFNFSCVFSAQTENRLKVFTFQQVFDVLSIIRVMVATMTFFLTAAIRRRGNKQVKRIRSYCRWERRNVATINRICSFLRATTLTDSFLSLIGALCNTGKSCKIALQRLIRMRAAGFRELLVEEKLMVEFVSGLVSLFRRYLGPNEY